MRQHGCVTKLCLNNRARKGILVGLLSHQRTVPLAVDRAKPNAEMFCHSSSFETWYLSNGVADAVGKCHGFVVPDEAFPILSLLVVTACCVFVS